MFRNPSFQREGWLSREAMHSLTEICSDEYNHFPGPAFYWSHLWIISLSKGFSDKRLLSQSVSAESFVTQFHWNMHDTDNPRLSVARVCLRAMRRYSADTIHLSGTFLQQLSMLSLWAMTPDSNSHLHEPDISSYASTHNLPDMYISSWHRLQQIYR